MESPNTMTELTEMFGAEQAIVLMTAIQKTIEEKEMASKTDLELQRAETATLMKEMQNEQLRAQYRTTMWLIGAIMSAAGLIIAAIKFF